MEKYPGMYKQYFVLKSSIAAKKMADELRSSISSISPNILIGRHPLFIVYCNELVHELQLIRNINQKIWRLTDKLPTVALQQFLKSAMIEEIHQNNEMENIHSTRKEIKDEIAVIRNGKKGKRFDGMIRKYELLLNNEVIPLFTCQDVRDLYNSFVLDEVIKEDPSDIPDGLFFRKGPVSVTRSTNIIHEGVFPETALNQAMESALSLLNNEEYDPLIRISAFHYLFGYIHPFYNGNGRMTRFISSYCLSSEGIHFLVSLRLSYVIKSHKALYYRMFRQTNDPRNYGDATRFVVDFLCFIHEACEQVLSFLNEKHDLIRHYQNIIDHMAYDEETKQLLFILTQVSVCGSDSLSMNELASASQMSMFLLRKRLNNIEHFIFRSSSGKAKLIRADLQKLDEAVL